MALLLVLFLYLLILARGSPIASSQQYPIDSEEQVLALDKTVRPKKVAIIGSGISGSVAAYNLYESIRTKPEPQPEITVFERNPIVGGRITQAFAFNDPKYPVDTCAATFSIKDQCIAQSLVEVGLRMGVVRDLGAGVGVWDGNEFVGFVEDDDFRNPLGWSLFRSLRWMRRYGDAPQRVANAATNSRVKFQSLLQTSGPLPGSRRNLTQQVQNSGLLGSAMFGICSSSGGSSMKPILDCFEGTDSLFLKEVLNAGVRERYFEDVGNQNQLDTFFGYEAEMPILVQGGNLRLVERLLLLSRARTLTNANVTSLSKVGSGWELNYTVANGGGGATRELAENFDIVVIATSLSLANISFSPPLTDQPGLEQTYDDSYVTHFTTRGLLNGSFFGREDVPQTVLTSPIRSDTKPPFLSLSLVSQVRRRDEYLYKVVSLHEISDQELNQYVKRRDNDDLEPLITWIDRQPLPKSLPKAGFNRGLLQDIEIAPNVFYAGGGEQVAATAEFGCRMGLNVAKIIAEDP